MTNQDLVQNLISRKVLITPRIIEAFEAIDRKDFVLPEDRERAYENRPLSIGFEATISQPYTIAFMLEKLQVQEGDKILEIGTGSGYLTALLAKIARDPGEVFSIEYMPELKDFAQSNLDKYGFKNIALFTGDGKKGLKGFAPFDKIISSARADEIPKPWKEQIRIGGRILSPVAENLMVIDRESKRKFSKEIYSGFIFVPLK